MRLVEERGRLAPRDLFLAPVRELGWDGGVDVRADLRVACQLDRAAGGLDGVLEAPRGHVVIASFSFATSGVP